MNNGDVSKMLHPTAHLSIQSVSKSQNASISKDKSVRNMNMYHHLKQNAEQHLV